MPRQSAEARGASVYRSGGTPPAPPAHLTKASAAVWVELAASKPSDWFDAGAQILLENLCDATVEARGLAKRLLKLEKAELWTEAKACRKELKGVRDTIALLSTKLRLSVQAQMDRRSGKILERGTAEAKPDRLLGGKAVWGEGSRPN